MRDLSKYEEQFISMIGTSEETAVRCRDLPFSPRDARYVTASLRQKGVPVVTSDAGYWVAENQDDIDRTVAGEKIIQLELQDAAARSVAVVRMEAVQV